MATLARARAAKKKLETMIAGEPGVNGVGIVRDKGQYAVKVNLSGKEPVEVPRTLGGVAIRVEVVGTIRKQRA